MAENFGFLPGVGAAYLPAGAGFAGGSHLCAGVSLPAWGRVTGLSGVSIFFGLLVSRGAGGVILSIVAGFILVYTRAFRVGDLIRFADIQGFVEEKSLFVTRIRTIENVLVSVPNADLLTGNIANYNALIRERQGNGGGHHYPGRRPALAAGA
jgi:hypothetical protein